MSVSIADLIVPNSQTIGFSGGILPVTLSSSTQFQGVPSANAIAAGTFINMDVAPGKDGSYMATRVEVQDANAINVASGLDLEVVSPVSSIWSAQSIAARVT